MEPQTPTTQPKVTIPEDSDDEENLFKNYEKTWTTEELSKEIDELAFHPLFIKPTENFRETPALLGLQNLLYNEDDHSLATNFANQASEILNDKYLTAKDQDSQNFYLRKALEKINEAIPLELSDVALMVKLLSNRSYVNGKLRNLIRQLRQSH